MNYKKLILLLLFGLIVALAALPGSSAMVDDSIVSATTHQVANAMPERPSAVAAVTNIITLQVTSARTEPYWNPDGTTGDAGIDPGVTKGDTVTDYKWIINVDNVGDPRQPRYSPDGTTDECAPFRDEAETIPNVNWPESCNWPSVKAIGSSSPIVTQGTEIDLSSSAALTLPDGNYLISVVADGFKIDGQWFTLPMEEDANNPGVALVKVAMQPYPLPASTMAFQVFNDNALPNSAADVPAEVPNPGEPIITDMSGFVAHVGDWAGEVTNDVYGNPLCTEYEPGDGPNNYMWVDGAPVPIEGTGGACVSGPDGRILIPNLSTNRWEAWVVPPDGSDWVQTTTLEGNKPWDTWLQEGSTGMDTEFVIGTEPFPFTVFGFVHPTDQLNDVTQTGVIKGVIAVAEVYIPFNGGLPYQGHLWGGLSGTRIRDVVANPWIALSNLQGGDTAVWVGQGDANGYFEITNVPDGDYLITYWDEAQLNILDLIQVTVKNGEIVDVGVIFVTGWFTTVQGFVFVDTNENGKRDPGEQGVSEFPIVARRRENTEMDRGAILVPTNADGSYEFENMYPLNNWIIMEAYAPNYRTTGYTYQAFNQPEETTILGGGVDIQILPIIGQSARVDWGVKPYEAGTNGSIAGTVFYDSTRAEYDPSLAAVEPWSPGIPGLTLNLYEPVPCGTNPGAACSDDGHYELAADGSYAKGALIETTETETYERPRGCQAYDVDGNPVDHWLLPAAADNKECLEPMHMGTQISNDFTTVDGNYGFGELPIGDYLVEVVVPTDPYTGRPVYQVESEETLSVFTGNEYIPQPDGIAAANPPDFPICAGPLHTVDVADAGTDNYGPVTLANGITVPASMPYDNPDFAGEGGSIYEGTQRHYCDTKLVSVIEGRSVAPAFTFFTETPIPGRWWGLILDDLTLSTDPREWTFGEKAGIPTVPIGIYDYSNRLMRTIVSDPNGLFEALMPSTTTMNAPSPSGVYANMFRLVGNDPGQPGRLNPDYNPQYRTISANFEVYPGIGIIADLAPTQVAVSIQSPGTQFNHVALCKLADTTPEFFAVDKVVLPRRGTDAERTINIFGRHFGDVQGNGYVALDDNQARLLNIVSWTDTQITATVQDRMPRGPHQLTIRLDNGEALVNGITLHIIAGTYQPTIFEVGPGMAYDPFQINPATGLNYTIQDALNDAAAVNDALVLVYNRMYGLDLNNLTPEQETELLWNPNGVYYENLVMHSPVKLQGFGPGGVYDNGDFVLGSVLNGLAYAGDNGNAAAWRDFVSNLNYAGQQQMFEGAVVSVFAETATQFTAGFYASIDGFKIEGGDQQGFPNNINQIGGGNNGQAAAVVVQGGGVFVNGYARYLRITNNVLQNNGGSYAGAIRLGTPNIPAGDPNKNSQNDRIRILNNQILANGGTNLAGAIGIFDGADRYEVAYNDICGNYSAEYGGGISHYGYSNLGSIHNNRIYFNSSLDEGGGIMIAGELPSNPASMLSPGSGRVDIYSNIVQANMSNDDGGGLRFLMAGNYPFNVYNNMFLNNISTHEGGGVSLNDAPNVRFYNNTVAKNLTTATALTSNGQPAPAGFSTSRNSALLQATLPGSAPTFSNPFMFNNIFWDNRAGSWNGDAIAGIGQEGDPNDIYFWDMGLSDLTHLLSPTNSILTADNNGGAVYGVVPDASNLVAYPGPDALTIPNFPEFLSTFDVTVQAMPWRTNPNFVGVIMVAVDLPPNLMGNYHIQPGSPAVDAGAASKGVVSAPVLDIDGEIRILHDMGADEVSTAAINNALGSGFAFGPNSPAYNVQTVIPGSGQSLFTKQYFFPIIFQQ
jgi:hypothetical protein